MRSVFAGDLTIIDRFQSGNGLWEYSDAIVDWCPDADGRGAVFLRFTDLPDIIDPGILKFIDNMDQAGIEVVITVRSFSPANKFPMDRLSVVALTGRLQLIKAWLSKHFPGRKWCVDSESYDGTAWKAVENSAWPPEAIILFRNELFAQAVLRSGVIADYGMPHMSVQIGKRSYAEDVLAHILIGWFLRYKSRRPKGTATWQPLITLQPKVNIPPEFALDRVKVEAFFASSDGRVVSPDAGTWEYQTYNINDPLIANSAGRAVWVYTDQTTDDLTTVLRQAK